LNFEDRHAFHRFSSAVRLIGRFALSQQTQDFLRVFRHQARARMTELPVNSTLYRAVSDYNEVELPDGGLDIWPASEDRIRPKPELVSDGRVNPRGIAYLYLASSIDTAISEVRPWMGEGISVAYFRTTRAFSLVDLSKNHGKWGMSLLMFPQRFGDEPVSAEFINQYVWTEVDNAFSRPVSRSDSASSYAPTQILAEALKEEGYDGVIYKSSFGGEKGYNVALFDGSDTVIVKCALHRVKAISFEHEEDGNPWYRQTKPTL
jgi:hypothetical protein